MGANAPLSRNTVRYSSVTRPCSITFRMNFREVFLPSLHIYLISSIPQSAEKCSTCPKFLRTSARSDPRVGSVRKQYAIPLGRRKSRDPKKDFPRDHSDRPLCTATNSAFLSKNPKTTFSSLAI
ncbi:hypothetical protein AVEN_64491-1, partial [Araneus ventricosus]